MRMSVPAQAGQHIPRRQAAVRFFSSALRPDMAAFGAVVVRFCEKLQAPLTKTAALRVIAFAALWTNLHGSFFFAILIPLIWALGTWLNALIWTESGRSGRSSPGHFLYVGALAAAGTLLNPN